MKTDYRYKTLLKKIKPHKPDGHIETACRSGKGYVVPLDSLISQYKYCVQNNVDTLEYIGIKNELKRRINDSSELEEM